MKSYAIALLEKLQNQRLKAQYCDIEIQVDDRLFYGHKCILSAASPCLEDRIKKAEAAFYNSDILHRSQIRLSGISSDGFQSTMEFIYSGKANLSDANVTEISNAAMVLDIPDLLKECIDFKRKELVVTSYTVAPARTPSLTAAGSPVIVNVSDEGFGREAASSDVQSSVYEINEDGGASSLMETNEELMNAFSKSNEVDENVSNSSVPETHSTSSEISPSLLESSAKEQPESSMISYVQSFDTMSKDPAALPTLLNMKNPPMLPDNQGWQDLSLSLPQNGRGDRNHVTEEVDEQGNPVWRCGICNKLFNKLSYLKYVHIRLHEGNRPHTCLTCGKTFATKGNLLQHHKSHLARSGILPYKCRYCKKGFSLKGNCLKHEKTHTKPYRCEFCLRSFPLKATLLQHIAKVHEDVADQASVGSQCSKCGIKFKEAFGEEYLSHKCGVFLNFDENAPLLEDRGDSFKQDNDV